MAPHLVETFLLRSIPLKDLAGAGSDPSFLRHYFFYLSHVMLTNDPHRRPHAMDQWNGAKADPREI